MLLSIPDEEEEELNLDDQDEQGNLKGFINDDDDEEEEEEASDSGDSEDDVGHKKRKRSKFCDDCYLPTRHGVMLAESTLCPGKLYPLGLSAFPD